MKSFILILLLFTGFNTGYCQSITKNHDLTFGTIVAGAVTDISVTNENVAKYTINSANSKPTMYISFVLPAYLTSSGKPNIPVTFDLNHTSYRKTTNDPNGSTFFNPYTTLTLTSDAGNTKIYVWIGGYISPPAGAAPASYTATITINVTQQ